MTGPVAGPPDWLRARLFAALDHLSSSARPEAAIAAIAARHQRSQEEVLLVTSASEALALLARAQPAARTVCIGPAACFAGPATGSGSHPADSGSSSADSGDPAAHSGSAPAHAGGPPAHSGGLPAKSGSPAIGSGGPAAGAAETILRNAGHDVRLVALDASGGLDPDAVPDDADLVVVASPADAGGPPLPSRVLERLAQPGRILVIDETHADGPVARVTVAGDPHGSHPHARDPQRAAMPGGAGPTGTDGAASRRDLPGLVALRGLAAVWGLDGLGAGYLLGEASLVAVLRRHQPAQPVSVLALVALEACSQPEAVAWASEQAAARTAHDAPPPEDAFTAHDALPPQLLPPHQPPAPHHPPQHNAPPPYQPPPPQETRTSPGTRTPHAARPQAEAPHGLVHEPGPARRASGFVTLIGAGPGGSDLITMRGWRALHEADVVVADRLADPGLTRQLRPGVLLINAGKAPGAQQLSQDQINQVLTEHALAGRRVARLKGGDPFVFGRGGEEAAACAAAGIACTVIPGLSSALAGPALAGIPLTHREIGQSFTVVSGHLPPDHPDSRVDWKALAAGSDTLVLLMAVRNLRAIAAHLTACGTPPETPAACVQEAGTPGQRIFRSTLGGLADPDAAPPVRNPAVVIIGPTAGDLIPRRLPSEADPSGADSSQPDASPATAALGARAAGSATSADSAD
ncbi:MAG TPA: uroporphyrinogen-III C-methyltransferase [Streptosporangiaceae bacterium]|nr:uroporphyrinogen-III C-methyltransferase [Streptosporangiaceae bacterium]